jgi:hypothetical protein
MTFIKRLKYYRERRHTLKYILYKFLKKHSEVRDDSPMVIIWDFGGYGDLLKKNAIFSAALNVRGYRTHFILCDGLPEACIQRGIEKKEKTEEWGNSCYRCLHTMKYSANQYGVEYSTAKEYIDAINTEKLREISNTINTDDIYNYKYMGIDVGILAWSSLVRYMKGFVIEKKDLKKEDEIIYRKYFFAGLVNTFIADKVLEKFKPVSVFSSHGVYVDYSPVILLSFLRKISAVCWSSGYKNFLHYFTIPKKANKLEFRGITEPEWKKRRDKPLTESENKILDKYIHERFNKGNRFDFLNISLPEPTDVLRKKLGINNNNKTVCLFCHVAWDLSFDLSTMIFANANEWFNETYKAISEIKDVNWIIRVHPGEKASGSLYTVDDYIKENIKDIPPHIKILWSDSEINSYGLYHLIDAGITLFGTTGAELPLLGKNVISGGEAYFSNKGFSLDAKSKEEYFNLLKNAGSMQPLSSEQIEIARRYAYSYFIQRQIPLNIINKSEGHFGNIDLDKIDNLLPGKDIIIDAICESIIAGKDVILTEEMVHKVEADLGERFLPL